MMLLHLCNKPLFCPHSAGHVCNTVPVLCVPRSHNRAPCKRSPNLLEGIQKVTKRLPVYSEIASDEEAEEGAQDETPTDMIVANTAEQSPAIVANTAEQMPSGLFLAE